MTFTPKYKANACKHRHESFLDFQCDKEPIFHSWFGLSLVYLSRWYIWQVRIIILSLIKMEQRICFGSIVKNHINVSVLKMVKSYTYVPFPKNLNSNKYCIILYCKTWITWISLLKKSSKFSAPSSMHQSSNIFLTPWYALRLLEPWG